MPGTLFVILCRGLVVDVDAPQLGNRIVLKIDAQVDIGIVALVPHDQCYGTLFKGTVASLQSARITSVLERIEQTLFEIEVLIRLEPEATA